jgi:probable F420-dependent oxidoreductase
MARMTGEERMKIGLQAIYREPDGADRPWRPGIDELHSFVERADRGGYDSLWVGDHISYPAAILDPLLQLAQAAVISRRLILGTAVYLLPLRHPTPVAKEVATLDHLSEGRLIFGVGVGGEFPKEFEACGVPRRERGARLTEAIGLLRAFWTGAPVSHQGRFYDAFTDVEMQPPARQPGGPPIWLGGRSQAALQRAGRIGDGYVSYVMTPAMYRGALETIRAAAGAIGRRLDGFGTGHLLFVRLDATYEAALEAATATLSARYAMDFRKAAARYCALGPAQDVAERIRAFHAAGVRHIILDLLGPAQERQQQIDRFAADVMPLLSDLTNGGRDDRDRLI